MLAEKNLASCCHVGGFVVQVLPFSLLQKITELFPLDFGINRCLKFERLFYNDIFSVAFGNFSC